MQAKEYEYTCTLKMTHCFAWNRHGLSSGKIGTENLTKQNVVGFVETAQMHYI
jgi:hypothetical protein